MGEHHNEAQAVHLGIVTSKVPPTFDGHSSWFEYEDSVLDWVTYTELPPEKQAMACKMRLTAYAADLAVMFQSPDERRNLSQADGLTYFLAKLRPHFIKGATTVFLYRYQQLMTFRRGTGDLTKWIPG